MRQMKDSGIEWIGEIPEGWEIATLRHCIASIESGTSVNAGYYPAEENEYGVLKTSCVYNDNFNYNENKSVNYDEYERVKCPVKKHCLIISRMNTPDLVGSCGYTESSYQNIFLPDRLWQVSFLKKFYYKFIYYFFASHATKIYISSHATGTSGSMKNISQKQLVNTPFVFPPFSEQERIADYLDAKCAHIDQCLELTRQSMEKLRAYKLSCITEAVTKGLDPDAPLKDSGVPWIGQIPMGWKVCKLKHIGKISGGTAFPIEFQGKYCEKYPFYKVSDLELSSDGIHLAVAQNSISENIAGILKAKIIPAYSIIYAKIGAALLLNRRRISINKCIIDNNMSSFTPHQNTSLYFSYYLLSSIDFKTFIFPGTIPSFSEGNQAKIYICLPPPSRTGAHRRLPRQKVCAYRRPAGGKAGPAGQAGGVQKKPDL